jgi:hypothetical protein
VKIDELLEDAASIENLSDMKASKFYRTVYSKLDKYTSLIAREAEPNIPSYDPKNKFIESEAGESNE